MDFLLSTDLLQYPSLIRSSYREFILPADLINEYHTFADLTVLKFKAEIMLSRYGVPIITKRSANNSGSANEIAVTASSINIIISDTDSLKLTINTNYLIELTIVDTSTHTYKILGTFRVI